MTDPVDVQRLIVRQSSLKCAVDLVNAGNADKAKILELADALTEWVYRGAAVAAPPANHAQSIPLQAAPPTQRAPLPPPQPTPGGYPPCERCGSPLQHKSGVSRKTGKSYDMIACTNRDCQYIMPDALAAQYKVA